MGADTCKKCGQLIGDHSYGQCPGTLGSAAALFGSMGGRARSKAKAEAARSNGRKGGRPTAKTAWYIIGDEPEQCTRLGDGETPEEYGHSRDECARGRSAGEAIRRWRQERMGKRKEGQQSQ